MRSIIILLTLLFFSTFIFSQEQGATTLKFDEEEFDFGDVKINAFTSHVFYFTNTGRKPLTLRKVTSSCGCTTPQWDSLPVAPGKKGSITVLFQCFPLEKKFTKTITIESNAEPTKNFLDIKGACIDIYKTQKEKYKLPAGSFLFDNTHINFDKLYNNETLTQMQMSFFNNSDDTISIFEFRTPAHIQCAAQPNIVLPHAEARVLINYNASLNPILGFKLDRFHMLTNDKDMPDKTLFVSAEIMEYFDTTVQNNAVLFLKETSFEFGKIKVGDIKTHVFEIKNTGSDTLFIRDIKASCGCTVAKLSNDKIAPKKTAQLKIEYNTSGAVKGINNKPITIISTDRKHPVIHIGVSAIVE